MTKAGSAGPLRDFAYRQRWTVIVACALFFGACAAFIGTKAAHNDRGVIINGAIELGPSGATVFYLLLFGGSIGFVLMSLFLAYHRLTYRQRLVLGETALLVPATRWSRRTIEIPYGPIRELVGARVGGQRFLHVLHPAGKYRS